MEFLQSTITLVERSAKLT